MNFCRDQGREREREKRRGKGREGKGREEELSKQDKATREKEREVGYKEKGQGNGPKEMMEKAKVEKKRQNDALLRHAKKPTHHVRLKANRPAIVQEKKKGRILTVKLSRP